MKNFIISITIFITCISYGSADNKPNILWITSEDNSPYLGCYGDEIARTPHIDAFAQLGSRYDNCFSNAAVCAPARQTLITGVYATSLGGQHMRSDVTFPDHIKYFPAFLKNNGYFTTNNNKTDYNGGPKDRKAGLKEAWDQNSNKAHWKNRPEGKPFFSVFNLGQTHESRLFPKVWKDRELKTDPRNVTVPKYLPDTSTIRLDIARYYDCIEEMDSRFGELIDEVKAAGLFEDTIIFYFSDHGGSLPRGKSYIYDSGTRVPLIVYIPEKWKSWRPTQPSKSLDRLVSFVDFAPTVLNLAGLKIPDYIQGIPFLGPDSGKERDYVFTFRGRRGERYNIMRGVRSKNFLYIRNFTPHEPLFEHNGYSFGIPSYTDWAKNYLKSFYDSHHAISGIPISTDSKNTLSSPEFLFYAHEENGPFLEESNKRKKIISSDVSKLKQSEISFLKSQHKKALKNHIIATKDSVFYAEGLGSRNYWSFQNEQAYPIKDLYELIDFIQCNEKKKTLTDEIAITNLQNFMQQSIISQNPIIRYWGTLCSLSKAGVNLPDKALFKLLKDPEPLVQIIAARALTRKGIFESPIKLLKKHLNSHDEILQLCAILIVDYQMLEKKDGEILAFIKTIDKYYAKRVADWILIDRKL